MPKYQTNAQRHYRYERIAKAEGEQCIVCWIEKKVRRGPPSVKLEIDHADGNKENWSWDNLHLVCHRDNCRLREMTVKAKVTMLRTYSDQLERERERENLPTWKTLDKEDSDYRSGPPEMKANSRYEPKWLNFIHGQLKADGSILREDAISGGAHYSGCAVQTSRNYLTKHTSPWSCFKEKVDSSGNKVIVYRNLTGRPITAKVAYRGYRDQRGKPDGNTPEKT